MLKNTPLCRLVALLAFTCTTVVDASPIVSQANGLIVPLHKRAEVPLVDSEGVINWNAASAHVTRTSHKYDGTTAALQRRSQFDDLLTRRNSNTEIFAGSSFQDEEQLNGDNYDPLAEARAAFAFGTPKDKDNRLLVRHKRQEQEVDQGATISGTGNPNERPTPTWAGPSIKETEVAQNLARVSISTTETSKKSTVVKGKPETSSDKAGASKTASVADATSLASNTGSTGAVKLTPYDKDQLWAGTISIGTPAQDFIIDFDTGSADLWIPSVNCSTKACKKHTAYDASKSSTSTVVPGSTLQIQYGDGSTTSGRVFTDVVSVGGVIADEQTFGAAGNLDSSWTNDAMDGIMGMAYESISQLDAPPFFQTLMSQDKVAEPQFSFALSQSNSGSSSELYLGGADSSRFSGEFEWHSVSSKSYWVIKGSANINSTAVVSNAHMVIDTGTTMIVAPLKDAKAFWSQVPGAGVYGQGYYTYPCDAAPKVSLNFGGKDWELPEASLSMGKLSSKSKRCVGSIVGQDVGMNAWIVGDKFLTNVYASFSFGKNAVGFAARK